MLNLVKSFFVVYKTIIKRSFCILIAISVRSIYIAFVVTAFYTKPHCSFQISGIIRLVALNMITLRTTLMILLIKLIVL